MEQGQGHSTRVLDNHESPIQASKQSRGTRDTTPPPNETNQTAQTPTRRNNVLVTEATTEMENLRKMLWTVQPTHIIPCTTAKPMKLMASFDIQNIPKGSWSPLIAIEPIMYTLFETTAIEGLLPIGYGNEREAQLPTTIHQEDINPDHHDAAAKRQVTLKSAGTSQCLESNRRTKHKTKRHRLPSPRRIKMKASQSQPRVREPQKIAALL